MKFSTLCLIVLFGLTACNSSAPENNNIPSEAEKKRVDQKTLEANIITEYVKANGLKGQITDSGIFYVIEKVGEGPSAKDLVSTSRVVAHYHGTTLDGAVFDSSVDKGVPFDFKLGQVIPGWQEGLRLLNVGGKGVFIIPSHLAYGARGYPGLIPPNTVLRFDVELLEL